MYQQGMMQPPTSVVTCTMDRNELEGQFARSQYGANEAIFDAYFVRLDGTPHCAVCHRLIGEHPPRHNTPATVVMHNPSIFRSDLTPTPYVYPHRQEP